MFWIIASLPFWALALICFFASFGPLFLGRRWDATDIHALFIGLFMAGVLGAIGAWMVS